MAPPAYSHDIVPPLVGLVAFGLAAATLAALAFAVVSLRRGRPAEAVASFLLSVLGAFTILGLRAAACAVLP